MLQNRKVKKIKKKKNKTQVLSDKRKDLEYFFFSYYVLLLCFDLCLRSTLNFCVLLFHFSIQVYLVSLPTSYTVPSASLSFLLFPILRNVFFCLPSLFS